MKVSRRTLFGAGGAALIGAGAGYSLGDQRDQDPSARGTQSVDPSGTPEPSATPNPDRQWGVDYPPVPQAYALFGAYSLRRGADQTAAQRILKTLGERVLALPQASEELPDGVGDLTAHVGVGASLLDRLGSSLAADTRLPAFKGDDALTPRHRSADLALHLASSNLGDLSVVESLLTQGLGLSTNWAQLGLRGSSDAAVTRNPFGFFDGIQVPQTRTAIDASVWRDTEAGEATFAVVRRLELDVANFSRLAVRRQEAIMGRRKGDGAPLSGGAPLDPVNLLAKTPSGEYLVPVGSHARSAHPSFHGSPLMLRRSYGFTNSNDDGPPTSGLLFISFQESLETFTKTQLRMDEVDELMDFATIRSTMAYLVPPPPTADRPLGTGL